MTKSDDISENLRKEENEQWHRRYEAKIQEAIEKLSGLIEHKEWIEIKETVETIMETVQNMAFMERTAKNVPIPFKVSQNTFIKKMHPFPQWQKHIF